MRWSTSLSTLSIHFIKVRPICPDWLWEGNGESLGQLDEASLSNCRELRAEGGVNSKP
jgi:hypothetical protein